MARKTCGKCRAEKPLEDFYRRTASKDGLMACCKACDKSRIRAAGKKYRKAQGRWGRENPELKREKYLKAQYGLEPGQYEAMHDLLAGKCAICGGTEPVSGRRLAVDHDHRTGLVRGLLCTNCNQGLGKFKDSPNTLLQAALYLIRTSQQGD